MSPAACKTARLPAQTMLPAGTLSAQVRHPIWGEYAASLLQQGACRPKVRGARASPACLCQGSAWGACARAAAHAPACLGACVVVRARCVFGEAACALRPWEQPGVISLATARRLAAGVAGCAAQTASSVVGAATAPAGAPDALAPNSLKCRAARTRVTTRPSRPCALPQRQSSAAARRGLFTTTCRATSWRACRVSAGGACACSAVLAAAAATAAPLPLPL